MTIASLEIAIRWWIDPEGIAHAEAGPREPGGPKMACCGKWAELVDWHELPGGADRWNGDVCAGLEN